MSYTYNNMASFASSLLAPKPPRQTLKRKGKAQKRKRSDKEAAYTFDDGTLHNSLQDALAKDTSDKTRLTKKRILQSIMDLVGEELTPASKPVEKADVRVLEEIYRELFERIKGRAAVMSRESSLEWKNKVQNIEGAEAKFLEVC